MGDFVVKLAEYLNGVKTEMKKVKWPKRIEVAKGLVATLMFSAIVTVFFLLADAAIVSVKELLF
jgi:preprotein translocase SecE subunit